MANNDREIALRISAQAEGNEQIKALALELDKLAKEGGEAAPAFAALSAKLKELGGQQNLIQQFAELKRVTVESGSATKAATTATAEAARALRDKQAALTSAKAAEEQATAALTSAKAAVKANSDAAKDAAKEIAGMKAAISASGTATAEQKAVLDDAKTKLAGYRDAAKLARDNVAALAPAQREAASAAKQATADYSAASRSFDQSKRAAAEAKAAYQSNAVSLQELRNTMRASGIESTSLAQAQQRVSQATSQATAEANRLAAANNKSVSSIGQMAGAARGLVGPLAAAFTAERFISTNVALENIERTFTAVTGSAKKAADEMAYVRGVVDKYGLSSIDAAKSYASLMAATKGTAVEGQKTRDVFEAVSFAMSTAGKTGAETERAFMALAQMASKGVISMEEMRQQLGESLPGALNAAANGFGITTKELNDLIESGKLTAQDLFPALTKGLKDLYGANKESAQQTQTLTQHWNRFQNQVGDVFKTIGDAGVIKGLGQALDYVSGALTTTSIGFVSAGKYIGTFLAALANGDIGIRGFSDNAKRAFAEIAQEAEDKLLKAAGTNHVLAAGLEKVGVQVKKTSSAMTGFSTDTEYAGSEAESAGTKIVGLNARYAELHKQLNILIEQDEKRSEARKSEMDSANAMAQAIGNEKQILETAAKGSEAYAASLEMLASRRRAEADAAGAQYQAVMKLAEQEGKLTDERQKQIKELKDAAEARKIDAEKAEAQAAASRLAANSAAVEAEAYKDNSARVYELAAAYEQAKVKVEELARQKAAGQDVSQQLAVAELALAKSAALYKDALNDQKTAIDANLKLKQTKLSVEQAGIQLAIAQQQSIYEVARATGNEKAAAEALLNIKRLEIQMHRLTAEAKALEAKATLEKAEIDKKALILAGQWSQVKEAEYQAIKASVQVKELEAQISEETANRLEQLAAATEAQGRAAAGAVDGNNALADSIGRVADATERKNSLQGGGKKEDRSADTSQYFKSLVYRATAGDNELAAAAMEKIFEYYNAESSRLLDPTLSGQIAGEQDYRNRIKIAEQKALEEALAYARKQRQGTAADGTAATASGSSGATTVNIRINGKTTPINVASQADANSVIDIMRQLEAAAARAL